MSVLYITDMSFKRAYVTYSVLKVHRITSLTFKASSMRSDLAPGTLEVLIARAMDMSMPSPPAPAERGEVLGFHSWSKASQVMLTSGKYSCAIFDRINGLLNRGSRSWQ